MKAIDNPEVQSFMKKVGITSRNLAKAFSSEDVQNLIEDLAEYFAFKLNQMKVLEE